ncbi:MAG TPA: TetR/AcrR family transcriptional regulator, partial [Longimicrobium sp.]
MTDPHAAADAGGVRERILNAALEILREEGIQELTQVQVSRRAGVRQSHLTYYFPRRHDLVEAVAVRFMDGMEHGLRAVAAHGAAHPGELLRRVADAIAEPWHMRMFTGVVIAADGDPALRAVIVREMARMHDVLADVVGGEDAKERVRLVMAAMLGLGLYRFATGEPAGTSS